MLLSPDHCSNIVQICRYVRIEGKIAQTQLIQKIIRVVRLRHTRVYPYIHTLLLKYITFNKLL